MKARRNNRSGNYSGKKGKSLTDTELNELDNFAFDEQTDNLNLDLNVPFMQDSLGARREKIVKEEENVTQRFEEDGSIGNARPKKQRMI